MLFAKSMVEKQYYLQQQVPTDFDMVLRGFNFCNLCLPQLYPDSSYASMKKSAQMYESIERFLNVCFERKEVPEQEMTLHKGD